MHREKLLRKNMDIIVLNSLRDEGAGFGQDTNRITIIDRYNNIDKFGLKSKEEAAMDILGQNHSNDRLNSHNEIVISEILFSGGSYPGINLAADHRSSFAMFRSQPRKSRVPTARSLSRCRRISMIL